jgi:peptide/nickel transport system permease protein
VKVAAAVLLLFVLGAIAAPALAPYDPRATPQSETQKNLPPSAVHPFGTDHFSRDVLSRVIYGARVSLGVAATSVLLALTLGTAVGALAGFAGGWTDVVVMRFVDAMLAVPRVLLLLVLVASTGPLPVGGITLLLGATGWMGMSRLVRGEVRTLREPDYVLASRAVGTPGWRNPLDAHPARRSARSCCWHAHAIRFRSGRAPSSGGVQPTRSWGSISSGATPRILATVGGSSSFPGSRSCARCSR